MSSNPFPKDITCWFWKNSSCRYSARQCKYAHYDTGFDGSTPPNCIPVEPIMVDKPSQSPLELQPVVKPKIDDADEDLLVAASRQHFFSSQTLCWALQQNRTAEQLRVYLHAFPLSDIKHRINAGPTLFGDLPIFYAVQVNSLGAVRLLLELGVSPNARRSCDGVPLLAFAIMTQSLREQDAIDVLATLLAYGADPESLPPDMWKDDYIKMPEPVALDKKLFNNHHWCMPAYRKLLAESFTLSQRYFVWKASQLEKRSIREEQFAAHHQIMNMWKLPYHIVGQERGTRRILEEILVNMVIGDDSPLALVFAGPSGHGKTEVAKSLGDYLSLPIEQIDCTEMRYETDLFGPKAPYHGHQKGSRLNNFLCREAGKSCIVFMDEFEKTDQDIWNALLLILDNGKHSPSRQMNILN